MFSAKHCTGQSIAVFFHGEDCFCCSQYFLNAHSSFCSVFPPSQSFPINFDMAVVVVLAQVMFRQSYH